MDKQIMKTMAERVFRDVSGAMATGLAWLGTETGLFKALADGEPRSVDALAAATGLVPRYVEEWARGMVAAGYLAYDEATDSFRLPPEHAWLLASEGTDHFMGGLFAMVLPLMQVAPRVKQAFSEGGGVPFADFPDSCRHAIDVMNRGNYEHRLVDFWLKKLPDTVTRLEAGGSALDVGCGTGQVVMALARGFPRCRVVGIDPDNASIRDASQAAQELPNAHFVAATLDQLAGEERFDLVTLCDCLHDLPAPLEVLADIRQRLADGGVMLVIEPNVADRLSDNVNPLGTMFYGFSVFHCMTQSLAQDGAGLGACLGPARTTALLNEAGFNQVDMLDMKSPVNLFYAARA